jgi:uncharacterized membrane protein
MIRQRHLTKLPFWTIPMMYAVVTIVLGVFFPRLEYRYLSSYHHGMTVSAATAAFSAVASGMLALTAIVFSLAFVMVQFSSSAYSPRLVLWLSRDPIIWHAMGIFTATFLFALVALGWVDRNGSGHVPFFSTWAVIVLLVASVLVLARLVQRLTILQVTEVLYYVSQRGQQVIHEVYTPLATTEIARQGLVEPSNPWTPHLPVTQIVTHTGAPMVIAAYNVPALVSLATQAGGVIVMTYAVGDTLLEGDTLLTVSGGHLMLSEAALNRAVELKRERTFAQDPKYALRLLVDIASKALSPAINDPTTAVQTLDHIEDLLRRLGERHLEVGHVRDAGGVLRVIFPSPTWEDFLMLAFTSRTWRPPLRRLFQTLKISARLYSKIGRDWGFRVSSRSVRPTNRFSLCCRCEGAPNGLKQGVLFKGFA